LSAKKGEPVRLPRVTISPLPSIVIMGNEFSVLTLTKGVNEVEFSGASLRRD